MRKNMELKNSGIFRIIEETLFIREAGSGLIRPVRITQSQKTFLLTFLPDFLSSRLTMQSLPL